MIIINGKVYGKNVTIINGRIVNDEKADCKNNIDETKIVNGNVKDIFVQSGIANINIIPTEKDSIAAHLYGNCESSKSLPKLNIRESIQKSVMIDIVFERSTMFTGFITLDIELPIKSYDNITVSSNTADISIDKDIKCNSLQIKTMSGDAKVYTSCADITINIMSGDIDLDLDAKEVTSIKLKTMSGDIDLKLNNVTKVNLSTTTMSGDIKNKFDGIKDGFIVTTDISTMSGDIKIR